MSRDLPAGLVTAIDAPVVRPFIAIRIELPDPVYVWTGSGTLIFDDASETSREWIGAGGLGSIDTVGEQTDGSATGVKVSLYNVPSEFREDIADQAVRGVLFEIYIGSLNETYQQVDAVQMLWRGKLDQYVITDGGDNLTVEITGESRGIDQRRPAIKRFTDEYHQRQHPGDLFFQYVSRMIEVPILWAAASQNSTTTGGGGGLGGGGGSSRNGAQAF